MALIGVVRTASTYTFREPVSLFLASPRGYFMGFSHVYVSVVDFPIFDEVRAAMMVVMCTDCTCLHCCLALSFTQAYLEVGFGSARVPALGGM